MTSAMTIHMTNFMNMSMEQEKVKNTTFFGCRRWKWFHRLTDGMAVLAGGVWRIELLSTKEKSLVSLSIPPWITRLIINRFKGTAQRQIQVNEPTFSVSLAAATADIEMTRRSWSLQLERQKNHISLKMFSFSFCEPLEDQILHSRTSYSTYIFLDCRLQ
jgi:hypothetical protein